MEESNDLLDAIRSLNSRFHVLQRDSQSLEMALTRVVLAGVEGPCVISFTSPRGAWAMEWNSTHSKWIERPELSSPEFGLIAEAFVKPVPNGYMVSFSDRSEPLMRWGLTADAISIRRAI